MSTTNWNRKEGKYPYEHTCCGITKKACHEIGEIVFIELPEVGQVLQLGDLVAVVESTKAAFDVYTSVGGTVVEVNSKLLTSIQLLNDDPEGAGWIYKVTL